VNKRFPWRWLFVAIAALALTIVGGYYFPFLFPGKRRWDYLSLLVIPVSAGLISGVPVAIFAFISDRRNREREISERKQRDAKDASQRSERDEARAESRRDEALQGYFDRVEAILIDRQVLSLADSATRLGVEYKDSLVESARHVIRARTLALLRAFSRDAERKSAIIRFLADSGILEKLNLSLAKARLDDADLAVTYLSGVDFLEANLRSADLSYADLGCASLSAADLSHANLNHANLTKSDLVIALLCKASLIGADLSEANLRCANLDKADISGANLERAIITGASLREADFSFANLRSADIRGAELFRAKLVWSSLGRSLLNDADLRQADLRMAKLNEADVSGADLRGAKLWSADLSGLTWNSGTQWPDIGNLRGAKNIPSQLNRELGFR